MSGSSDPAPREVLSEVLFFIRGISILLVVLVHVLGVESSQGLRKLFSSEEAGLGFTAGVIHSFNMAVMLITSGAAVALFGEPELPFREFASKKLRKLIVPMLVWAPVLFVLQEGSRARPRALEGWLALLGQVPTAWFPPYSIFWFVHALVGCTLLAWAYERLVPSRSLGARLGYLGLSGVSHLAAEAWGPPAAGAGVRYVRLILFCHCFFSLGVSLAPGLARAHRGLSRRPRALQVLVPMGLMGLLIWLQVLGSVEEHGEWRLVSGTLGFCMQFALAIILLGGTWGAGHPGLARWLVSLGAISMPLYLFHTYFVSGVRLALERVMPGAPLALHLALGSLVGLIGPWGLYLLLRRNPAFRWSIGLPPLLSLRPRAPSHAGLGRSHGGP